MLRKKKPGTSHESRPPGTTLKMFASLPKLSPPMRATSRIGPKPMVRPVTRPRLSVGYHSPYMLFSLNPSTPWSSVQSRKMKLSPSDQRDAFWKVRTDA